VGQMQEGAMIDAASQNLPTVSPLGLKPRNFAVARTRSARTPRLRPLDPRYLTIQQKGFVVNHSI